MRVRAIARACVPCAATRASERQVRGNLGRLEQRGREARRAVGARREAPDDALGLGRLQQALEPVCQVHRRTQPHIDRARRKNVALVIRRRWHADVRKLEALCRHELKVCQDDSEKTAERKEVDAK